MLKKLIVVLALASLAGCSFISIEAQEGPMEWMENTRYHYFLLIPKPWHRRVNSHVRPTRYEITAPKSDAGIVVFVKEGGELPYMANFKENIRNEDTEAFTIIREQALPFDDVTGYVVSFTWKGAINVFGAAEFGKPGVEYKGKLAAVNREPSPVFMLCYAETEKFDEFNQKYFGDALTSLKVKPVELTVREPVSGEAE